MSKFDDPVRATGATALFPLHPDDYEWLYRVSLSEFNSLRWRYRGQVPPFELFVQQLHSDVLVQFVAFDRDSGLPIGHVVAYAADMRNRHCYIGVVMDEHTRGHGRGSECLGLLSDYLFETWGFHKIFAEVPAFTLEPMQGKMDRLQPQALSFDIEGVLTEYLYHNGKFWDMYLVSTSLASWLQSAAAADDSGAHIAEESAS
ncbi:MAG TPA: GNAT family protein [Iamia sp.]|nr:GNAT family protein [Iamia sp.]